MGSPKPKLATIATTSSPGCTRSALVDHAPEVRPEISRRHPPPGGDAIPCQRRDPAGEQASAYEHEERPDVHPRPPASARATSGRSGPTVVRAFGQLEEPSGRTGATPAARSQIRSRCS